MSATGSTRSRIGIVESLSGPLVSIGAVLLAFLCGALMIVALGADPWAGFKALLDGAFGGRAELADTARAIAREVAAGRLNPDKVDERTVARHLYVPEQSDADMVWRTSGEQRLSNFMLWQSAYAELVFSDVLWPDVDRRHLWQAIETYASRDRRYGGAR